ncbi:Tetratricopeptide repeat (TPR)-like superfamily protein [Striga hermonthica]|uniref:Tetratricopeptide repeat (TPR)-like superfamily protein n=1 Tax=Striga hermonthica TaxID=68872 RepID=A0A9N7N9R2_STRHE|nr:Tetratricopeptide repeat (TPR)-like superfamily protein [Striga hermonthica]
MPANPIEPKSTKTPKRDAIPNWRVQIKKTQLVSQASAVLLQRHSRLWGPLLKPLKLSINFTPSLFHEILNNIQTHPKICFSFFEWAQKSLGFRPDPGARCRMVRILFGSGLSELGTPILNSVVQDCPSAKFLPLLIQSHKSCSNLQVVSPVLNSVIDFYCSKQMYLQSLEVYNMGKRFGFGLSLGTCNGLLSLLSEKKELKLAWCFYASVIRNGVLGDGFTWSIIARILYKDGQFERISRFLDAGMDAPEVFELLIDGYCKRGDFEAAFGYLNRLWCKGVEPSFSTYSSILDGACKWKNSKVIEIVMSLMVKHRHIPVFPASDYDMIIRKLCDLGRTFAADIFFERARDEKLELQDATYESMLRALLSVEGRIHDAIELYNIVRETNIQLSESCYNELVIAFCKENPSEKIGSLLVDIVRRSFASPANELSTYVGKLCAKSRWIEAEQLFYLVLGQGCLLDSISCSSLVKHYCFSRQIDRAILVHDKLKEFKGNLDTVTYNILLAALFKEKRIEKTIEVFDYMRECKKLDSDSFSIMIGGLCREKELRKAMKLHDEMLESGLKPDQRTYRRLISGFR